MEEIEDNNKRTKATFLCVYIFYLLQHVEKLLLVFGGNIPNLIALFIKGSMMNFVVSKSQFLLNNILI